MNGATRTGQDWTGRRTLGALTRTTATNYLGRPRVGQFPSETPPEIRSGYVYSGDGRGGAAGSGCATHWLPRETSTCLVYCRLLLISRRRLSEQQQQQQVHVFVGSGSVRIVYIAGVQIPVASARPALPSFNALNT